MWEDPIVKEIRQVREAHAARFQFNLDAIYRDIRAQEKASGRKAVSYPARPAKKLSSAPTGEKS